MNSINTPYINNGYKQEITKRTGGKNNVHISCPLFKRLKVPSNMREEYYFTAGRVLVYGKEHSKEEGKKNSLMALAQIKMFDEEQKDFFAELMANMIVVDEDIDANEVLIYDIVRDFAGIKKEFDKTI